MNVALYGTPRKWAMTERGCAALTRDTTHLTIGPSAMTWRDGALTITIDETTVPVPSRLRGTIVVRPRGLNAEIFRLDPDGRHRWRPIGPLSDVEVSMDSPDLAWRGTGYFDMNEGDEPLETVFKEWSWSRFDMGTSARVFYNMTFRDGSTRGLSLDIENGRVVPSQHVPYRPLPRAGWGMARAAPCDAGGTLTLMETLENAPFYARSSIRSTIDGETVEGVHESLSLTRLTAPIVRLMLPFRMPRRAPFKK